MLSVCSMRYEDAAFSGIYDFIANSCWTFRMDTTLVDFNEMKWERGDITFLFIGERKNALVVLDNRFKVYQYLRYRVCVSNLLSLFSNSTLSALIWYMRHKILICINLAHRHEVLLVHTVISQFSKRSNF